MRSRSLLAAVTAVLALGGAVPASALDVGISDQQASSFADARLTSLELKEARLIVPWDAATSGPAVVQAWLDAAQAAGFAPHVAFEHLLHQKCPARTCVAPTRAQYRAAVRTFIARFPQVRTYTSWNEANHESQPTANAPVAVAGYYDELRAACPSCTIVAGDVIDSGSYVQWLHRFRAAVSGNPQLWGLHNYTDVTFGTTSGTDAALAAVPGKLWIEETGGIVVRRDSGGHVLLAYDEARAARAVRQAFAIAATRPRITRMYLYQWRALAGDYFDAGLVRPDGSARASYGALVSGLGSLRAAAVRTTWSARWAGARTLLVRARCTSATRCRGRVGLVLRTLERTTHRSRDARLGARSYAVASARTFRVRVPAALVRRARAALRRSLVLTVRDRGRAARRVLLTLRSPR